MCNANIKFKLQKTKVKNPRQKMKCHTQNTISEKTIQKQKLKHKKKYKR